MHREKPDSTASGHTILDYSGLLTDPSRLFPITIEDEERNETVTQQSHPEILPLSKVLEEIETLTELPKARIATELFDVSRTAYHDWTMGKRVSLDNERRIRGTLEVLQRASVQHGNPELIRGWLMTPVGSRAIAPIALLKTGKVDEARLLAISTLPKRETALPGWLLTVPINEWSERERKRKNLVMRESDAIAKAIDED
jgi:hypothetical protein